MYSAAIVYINRPKFNVTKGSSVRKVLSLNLKELGVGADLKSCRYCRYEAHESHEF